MEEVHSAQAVVLQLVKRPDQRSGKRVLFLGRNASDFCHRDQRRIVHLPPLIFFVQEKTHGKSGVMGQHPVQGFAEAVPVHRILQAHQEANGTDRGPPRDHSLNIHQLALDRREQVGYKPRILFCPDHVRDLLPVRFSLQFAQDLDRGPVRKNIGVRQSVDFRFRQQFHGGNRIPRQIEKIIHQADAVRRPVKHFFHRPAQSLFFFGFRRDILSLQFFPVRFRKRVPVELSVCGSGHPVDLHEYIRDHVIRQFFTHPALQQKPVHRLRRGVIPDQVPFPVFFLHRSSSAEDPRRFGHHRLNFAEFDPVSADLDLAVDPAVNHELAGFGPGDQIAGVIGRFPAIAEKSSLEIIWSGISASDLPSADDQFPFLPRRKLVSVRIKNVELHIGSWPADGDRFLIGDDG